MTPPARQGGEATYTVLATVPTSKPEEEEATEPSGALLVPAEVAKAHATEGRPVESLTAKYGVSVEMAKWRMSGGPTIARRSASRRRPRPG